MVGTTPQRCRELQAEAEDDIRSWTGLELTLIERVELKSYVSRAYESDLRFETLLSQEPDERSRLFLSLLHYCEPAGEAAYCFLHDNYGWDLPPQDASLYVLERRRLAKRIGYDWHKEFWGRIQEGMHRP